MGYNIPSDHGDAMPKAEAIKAEEAEMRPTRNVRRWTQAQQDALEKANRELRELARTKEEIFRENTVPVKKFALSIGLHDFEGDVVIKGDDGVSQLSDYLIANCEELRDVLAPFDTRRT